MAKILHNVGNGWKIARIALLHSVEETLVFLPGKYFGKIKNGQKKCPKTDFAKILSPKYMFCDHN